MSPKSHPPSLIIAGLARKPQLPNAHHSCGPPSTHFTSIAQCHMHQARCYIMLVQVSIPRKSKYFQVAKNENSPPLSSDEAIIVARPSHCPPVTYMYLGQGPGNGTPY